MYLYKKFNLFINLLYNFLLKLLIYFSYLRKFQQVLIKFDAFKFLYLLQI